MEIRQEIGMAVVTYRAVGKRLAVHFDSLSLGLDMIRIKSILETQGFSIVEVDLVALARKCIGVSKYRRGARPSEAPKVVDCSSFIKWLYGQRGIWLPRRSIQQSKLGWAVEAGQISAGDVVFVSGRIDYYDNDPTCGIGHVGIATGDDTVIHAANQNLGVTETPLCEFIGEDKYRDTRRYIPKDWEVITLEIPSKREVEISDDIRWIILQSL